MQLSRVWLVLLVVLLASCGSGGSEYSAEQVRAAFNQAGITLHVTPIPAAYRPRGTLLRNVTFLTGGLKGNPNADVIVSVYGLGAGNAAAANYAHNKYCGCVVLANNVFVITDNLTPSEMRRVRSAMKDLVGHTT
jgi:hypothetical protein